MDDFLKSITPAAAAKTIDDVWKEIVAGAHPHQPAGAHPHQPAGAHPHQPAGAHPHQPAGAQPHQPAAAGNGNGAAAPECYEGITLENFFTKAGTVREEDVRGVLPHSSSSSLPFPLPLPVEGFSSVEPFGNFPLPLPVQGFSSVEPFGNFPLPLPVQGFSSVEPFGNFPLPLPLPLPVEGSSSVEPFGNFPLPLPLPLPVEGSSSVEPFGNFPLPLPLPLPVEGSSSVEPFGNGIAPSNSVHKGKRRVVEEPVDEATLQKQRRMIKNRESAARSRERKQAYTAELEYVVHQLEQENAQLVNEEAEMRRQRKKQLLENIIPVEVMPKPRKRLRRVNSA